jgi:hypothetical protein
MKRLMETPCRDYLGVLLAPANRNAVTWPLSTGLPWAADNGCFHRLDAGGFRRMVRRVAGQPRLLWVCCPDVVADARATLDLFGEWQPELDAAGVPVALVGQDGLEDLPIAWERIACLFVGGTTSWKLSNAAGDLVTEAKARGKWCHMGRVNSRKRLEHALRIGCDSVDGTGFSRWGDRHLAKFCRWLVRMQERPVLF